MFSLVVVVPHLKNQAEYRRFLYILAMHAASSE
jgi:hypothetical protein